MKTRLIAGLAGLLIAANAAAAIKIDRDRAQSMDDVHSLGIVYINHNSADNNQSDQIINEQTGVLPAPEETLSLPASGLVDATILIYR
ncbi:hypothetical protein [Atlantibacter hermannii]|uniref:YdgH/BhsA/McbA-like domain-containing protein n=1 Tax=Atlantibacter hermannii NBRC 105704 TaxID=1115512 RepID=H5UZD1_ATLHE|nr:hypothetical protein [Atlantibacter hermannii]MDU7814143.1 hypothetical protein [Atlantibacter hermannii]QPS92270.1 hypothetical protein I6G45_01610 [Atlantibacter hermannii]GAB51089.1 hypothetical protein YjfY [Atlantibacter hermannii NBRC 105704]VDZ75232.1 protein [Atlantibacter hermannii]